MRLLTLLLLVFSIALGSCDNTLEDYQPGTGGDSYFPLAVGHTWTYQLDSVIYDNNGTRIDSVSVQVREEITEKFTDPTGKEAFRIARYQYRNDGWMLTDVWSASKDERLAYRNEENIRFAKLSFPIVQGNAWDGNAFLNDEIVVKIAGEPIRIYQNWGNYLYESVDQAETINGVAYPAVCTVNQVDLEDKITRRYSLEKYAEGVGLVHKKMIILNTQKFDSTDPWELKAEEGFILDQQLIRFEPGG
jgi:hypothetical protein